MVHGDGPSRERQQVERDAIAQKSRHPRELVYTPSSAEVKIPDTVRNLMSRCRNGLLFSAIGGVAIEQRGHGGRAAVAVDGAGDSEVDSALEGHGFHVPPSMAAQLCLGLQEFFIVRIRAGGAQWGWAWDGLILIHPIAPAAANSVWLSWSCIYNLFSTRALGFCNLGNVQ